MRAPSTEDRDTSNYTIAMVIWTFLAVVGTGFLFFYIFESVDSQTGAISHTPAMFVLGMLAGALTTLPLWALFGLGLQLLRNTLKLRADLAESEGGRAP